MSESHEHQIKRLKMRSMRRGIKEMDIILGHFADTELAYLGAGDLALYDQLLSENDHDLYAWVSGASAPPTVFSDLIQRVTYKIAQKNK